MFAVHNDIECMIINIKFIFLLWTAFPTIYRKIQSQNSYSSSIACAAICKLLDLLMAGPLYQKNCSLYYILFGAKVRYMRMKSYIPTPPLSPHTNIFTNIKEVGIDVLSSSILSEWNRYEGPAIYLNIYVYAFGKEEK